MSDEFVDEHIRDQFRNGDIPEWFGSGELNPVGAVRQRVRRRSRRRHGLLATAAVIALFAAGAVALRPHSDSELRTATVADAVEGSSSTIPATSTEAALTNPPPAPEPTEVYLWLSAARVPPGSADLMAAVVNNSRRDMTFGVAANVERWDGAVWRPYGAMVMCLDHWQCSAQIQPNTERAVVPLIGLTASPGSPSTAERFTTTGLSPGWYRISQAADDGSVAAAVLEVAPDAEEPAPLTGLGEPTITIQPVIMSRGAETTLVLHTVGASAAHGLPGSGRTETVIVQQWTPTRWTPVGEWSLDLSATGDPSVEASVVIPQDLPSGQYRVIREDATAGALMGNFWVED